MSNSSDIEAIQTTPGIIEVNFKRPKPPPKPNLPALYLGRAYQFSNNKNFPNCHGLCGNYVITRDKAELLPMNQDKGHMNGFFWDTDVEFTDSISLVCEGEKKPLAGFALQGGNAQLVHATLSDPDLYEIEGKTFLRISPYFELEYRNQGFDSRLGLIRLLEATRFITLEDGKRIVVLDTSEHETPVLYLESIEQADPVEIIVNTHKAERIQTYTYQYELMQNIPDMINGQKVASVTVLEQYINYFMQQEISDTKVETIWTPVCMPISWGWSMRVEPRPDRSWYIARRKLMMPLTGHNGLEMPLWTTNSLNYKL